VLYNHLQETALIKAKEPKLVPYRPVCDFPDCPTVSVSDLGSGRRLAGWWRIWKPEFGRYICAAHGGDRRGTPIFERPRNNSVDATS
jgi:hypothetical protein